MSVLLLILGLILFIGLVVIHEFGHFTVARRNGVEAEEFGIGFPPRLWVKRIKSKRGDFDFTLNALPIGGFVKLKGEHDADTQKGTFGAASLKVKAKIMLAGVAMNLVVALVLFTAVALVGMPQIISKSSGVINEDQFTVASDERITRSDVVTYGIVADSPAAAAGIQPGDVLVSVSVIGQEPIVLTEPQQLPEWTSQNAGQEVAIELRRDGQTQTVSATLLSEEEVEASRNSDGVVTKGYLGLSDLALIQTKRYTWSAPVVAVGLSGQITKLTFQGIGTALKGLGSAIAGLVTFNSEARQQGQADASEQVSGPLGIFFVLKASAESGFIMLLFIIAFISLALAIMNILPIPALDGGRLYLTLIYRALNKPLTQKAEEAIVGTSFAALMILFILITIVDAKRFF